MVTTNASDIEQAFIRYQAEIYRFLLRRTRNHDDAEELTQQVFTDATSALARFDPPRSMRAWLYAVAERRLADEFRRRSRRPSIGDAARPEPAEDADTADALEGAILRLPEPQRRIVLMRIVEGRSYLEIARTLGCNEAACKMRLSRALRRLRADLEAAA